MMVAANAKEIEMRIKIREVAKEVLPIAAALTVAAFAYIKADKFIK